MLGQNLTEAFKGTNNEIYAPSKLEMDCSDPLSLKNYLSKKKPEFVIHCAGLVGGISANVKYKYFFFKENMLIGINLIDACVEAGVKNLINISSTNIYPVRSIHESFNEEDILAGKLNSSVEGYGLAKGCITRFAEYASKQFDVQYSSIILSNLYGKFDNFSSDAHVIPGIISRMHNALEKGHKTLQIWGDGSARRSFLYAEDVSKFIISLIEEKKMIPQNLNIAPKRDFSILEVNKIISEVVGFNGEFIFDKTKPEGVKNLKISCQKGVSLGWKERTSFAQGVSKTYQYFLKEIAQ